MLLEKKCILQVKIEIPQTGMLSVAVFTRLAPSVALITRKMRRTAARREIFIVITCCGNQIMRDMQTERAGRLQWQEKEKMLSAGQEADTVQGYRVLGNCTMGKMG